MGRRASLLRDPAYLRQWLVAVPLLVVLLAFLVDNTMKMNDVISQDAEAHVDDIASQVDDDVKFRLTTFESYIEDVANSFSYSDPSVSIADLIEDEQATALFEQMFVVQDCNDIVATTADMPTAQDWVSERSCMPDELEVSGYNGVGLAFAAPFERAGVRYTLVGIRLTAGTGPYFSDANYLESGFSILVDGSASPVAPACGEIPDDVEQNWGSGQTKSLVEDAVVSVADDAPDDPVKIRSVSMSDGSKGYIAASVPGPNDWVLLTFVPETAFSEQAVSFIGRYWGAILLSALTFVVVVFAIWRGYRHSMRRVMDALYTDELTGGLTERAFRDRARRLVEADSACKLCVAHVNIAGYRDICEHFGESAGEALIVAVHGRLEGMLREGELVARSDQDRFFVLLRAADDADAAARLEAVRAGDFPDADDSSAPMSVGLVVGVCRVRAAGEDVRTLQGHAERASRYCRVGGPCVFFSAEIERENARRIELLQSFESSLSEGRFEVYFQPQQGFGECEGRIACEALVRWNHPEFGMVSPGEFVPLLEENRLVHELDRYVFFRVCETLRSWDRGPLANAKVSVNLSRLGILEHGMEAIEDMVQAKRRYGIPDGRIEIEVTESMAIDARMFDFVRSFIDVLHRNGFSCAIDDFGAGYSSLAALKDFKMDAVKLDRGFFVDANEKCWRVVESFVALAHELGMRVVAEGVEDEGQLERLRAMGCDRVQGFVVARPMPRAAFEAWAADHACSCASKE